MNTRARLHPINEYTTLIDDDGHSTAYLIRGQDRAVLIDTLNGAEDLAELTRTLTPLPVMVVNTHGHLDHIGCSHFFPEAWMHQEDYSIYREHLGFVQQALRESGAPVPTGEECKIRFLEPGTAIDLGGVALEVVAIPGHTPGSIAPGPGGATALHRRCHQYGHLDASGPLHPAFRLPREPERAGSSAPGLRWHVRRPRAGGQPCTGLVHRYDEEGRRGNPQRGHCRGQRLAVV